MRPDLNKLKYLKLHRKKRIRRVDKGRKGRELSNYNFGMHSVEAKIITSNQLEAMRKLIVRKLKGKSNKNQKNLKIIKSQKKVKKAKRKKVSQNFNMRHNFSLGLTKKPLQVRMGKGKGNPVDWVYPCASNRVLLEFSINKSKVKKIKKILIKASEKLPCAVKLKLSNLPQKGKFIDFSPNRLRCIKEL